MLNALSNKIIINKFYKLELSLKTGSDRITSKKFREIINSECNIILEKINNNTYKFSRYIKKVVKKNRCVYSPTIRDRIVLDILKDCLIKKYSIIFPNKNIIIKNIISTLECGMNYTVIRLDIEKFYDNIQHNLLFNKLKNSSLLSNSEYLLIKRSLKQSKKGVLQGLPTSNCLAEIYLESFDSDIRLIDPRLCYYSRYVDDILLIFNSTLLKSETDNIMRIINNNLSKLNLSLNSDKSSVIRLVNNSNFDYLGYNFNILQNNKPVKATLTISTNKIKQIKSKIDYYFYQYKLNNNFNLLYQRLSFITSYCYGFKFKQYNTSEDNDAESYYNIEKICFGVFSSYYFSDNISFDNLNKHIKFRIKSNNFTPKQRKKLFMCKFNCVTPHVIEFHKFTNSQYLSLIRDIDNSYREPTTKIRSTLIFDYFKYLNP
ncbi:RNA-directed DNA polymerase [Clostridium paraputrificum]|uniref:RNA-directed DNA polymerase n=1 Tax=Clostridium paraputrificum TaxID=29363 RepID=UPI003D34CCA2